MVDGSGFPALEKISAIGYHDLMGEKIKHRRKKLLEQKPKEVTVAGEEVSSDTCYNDNSYAESSVDEEGSTTTSSTSSPKTTALKEWNGVRELAAGNKGLAGSGFLCCLVAQRNSNISR